MHPAQLESDPPLVVYLVGALLKSDLLPRSARRGVAPIALAAV